jgi:hypothetical protein
MLLMPLKTGRFPVPFNGKPVTLFELDCALQTKVAPVTPLDQATGTVFCPEQIDCDNTVLVTNGAG